MYNNYNYDDDSHVYNDNNDDNHDDKDDDDDDDDDSTTSKGLAQIEQKYGVQEKRLEVGIEELQQ